MKKAFLAMAILPLIAVACGPSEQEKKALQAKNEALINQKVEEALEQQQPQVPEASNPSVDSSEAQVAADSAALD